MGFRFGAAWSKNADVHGCMRKSRNTRIGDKVYSTASNTATGRRG